MQIPHWLKSYLTTEQLQHIADAVKQAESTTSGEIVPMIVRRSSTVGHVPVIGLSVLVALFFALDGPGVQGDWLGHHWAWYLGDVAVLLMVGGLLSRLSWVQRLLTPRSDQAVQVDMRAEIEFYRSEIKKTRDSTGVLIFVSLLERRAVVLADKAINDRVPADTWKDLCGVLTSGIKKKEMGVAFAQAIGKCGDILTPLFPIKPDDKNELKDQLVIKE